jgi:uncharacterized protein (DUF2249 family)
VHWDDVGPETKLESVLATWPEAERTLVQLAPAFRAFETPFLRKTFARAATMRQVAETVGVPVGVLLDALKSSGNLTSGARTAPGGADREGAVPAWAQRLPHVRHDARYEVEQTIHPLPVVLAELERLADGEVYELITPLIPAPLVGLLAKRGYDAHSSYDRERGFARTMIRRRPH